MKQEESDNQKLIRYCGYLLGDENPIGIFVTVQDLKLHIVKCQNRETCDNSIEPDIWNAASKLYEATEKFIQAGIYFEEVIASKNER